MKAARQILHTARTAPVFAAAVTLTLAAAGFNGLMVLLMALGLETFLPGPLAHMGHFTEAHHRTHDVTFAVLFVPAVLGLLAQLRRPRRHVAGMLMSLIPAAALIVVLLLTVVLAGDARVLQPPWLMVGAGALLATALHPAGTTFFSSFRISRLSRPLAALVAVAAAGLLPFAIAHVGLQAVPDDHAAAGHYGFMAAFALATTGLGVLASLRPYGWRLTAWTAGLLPVLLGATSLTYPQATSSLAAPWALAAIAWGAGFVAVSQLTQDPAARAADHACVPG